MSKITIWHNPRCTKSREAVKAVEESGSKTEIIKYLDEKPSVKELKTLLKMLGFKSAREWMRTKEAIYKELDLKNETDEEKLIEAMAENPKLIERPVLIKDGKAIVGRPASVIPDFLEA
jgi:arsenate reductase (glutaredoxin)